MEEKMASYFKIFGSSFVLFLTFRDGIEKSKLVLKMRFIEYRLRKNGFRRILFQFSPFFYYDIFVISSHQFYFWHILKISWSDKNDTLYKYLISENYLYQGSVQIFYKLWIFFIGYLLLRKCYEKIN